MLPEGELVVEDHAMELYRYAAVDCFLAELEGRLVYLLSSGFAGYRWIRSALAGEYQSPRGLDLSILGCSFSWRRLMAKDSLEAPCYVVTSST